MSPSPRVVVVGAGVTGSEAAYAASRAGADVTLVTTSLDTVYSLDEDPAAVEAPPGSLLASALGAGARSRWDVHRRAKYALEAQPGVHLLQSTASALLVEGGAARGVATWEGVPRRGDRVALCVGTFLRARLSVGEVVEQQGRLSEMAYDDLYEDLAARGFAFEELALEVAGVAGSLPHAVRTVAFAPAEWSAAELRLTRVDDLYAAGACVARRGGPPDAGACVAEGMRLGVALART
ncbi:MAG TPA: FAD-dependent oxidoreductase [Trueperaceae bacterium]|jgi:tRNA U34 5-carboxymethylaminomethyl modifying enzyme MnmG/GidA